MENMSQEGVVPSFFICQKDKAPNYIPRDKSSVKCGAEVWHKHVHEMQQLFSDLIREDVKKVEDGTTAQFGVIKTVFNNTQTWDLAAFDYIRDYTAFKVGENNRSSLQACHTLEDESHLNKIPDEDIFNTVLAPKSKSENDKGVSTAPFKTNAERKEHHNANIRAVNRNLPIIPRHEPPASLDWQNH